MATTTENLIAELDYLVGDMAAHLSAEQCDRLAILVTPDEAQLLAYAMIERHGAAAFVAQVDDRNAVWYSGMRVMIKRTP